MDPNLVEVRSDVRSGKPCFVGTRIAIFGVVEYLASGMTAGEIVADFPELRTEHVRVLGLNGEGPGRPETGADLGLCGWSG